MTCREKLMQEHPEWDNLVISKCASIFTPNEYFNLEGDELNWTDIYPGEEEDVAVEYSEDLPLNYISERDAVLAEYLIKQTDLKREFEVLKARATTQEDTIKNLMKNNADLRAKLEEKEEQLESYRKTNTAIKLELDVVKRVIDDLDSQNESLKIDISNKDEQIENQRKIIMSNWDEECDCSSCEKNVDLEKKLQTREEEIRKLVNENDALRDKSEMANKQCHLNAESRFKALEALAEKNKLLDEQLESINVLNTRYNDKAKDFENLKANIEKMGFEVDEDNNVIVHIDNPHFATAEEIADRFDSCSAKCAMHPTDIARGIARSIRNKYDALIYVGFSHDDAMSLLPKWEG